jgi:hypothetical protein
VLTGLPAGSFVVTAKAQFDGGGDIGATSTVDCTLEVGGVTDHAGAVLPAGGIATLPFLVPVVLPSGGSATLTCSGASVSATFVKITAIQIDNLF